MKYWLLPRTTANMLSTEGCCWPWRSVFPSSAIVDKVHPSGWNVLVMHESQGEVFTNDSEVNYDPYIKQLCFTSTSQD